MKSLSGFLGNTLFFALLVSAGFAAGVFADRQGWIPGLGSPEIPEEAQGNFRLLAEAWNIIHENYAERSAIDPQKLTYGAIGGMVDALGDTGHSRFMSPEMVQEERDYIQGQFEGIGAIMEMKDGEPVVVAPIDGSPAQKAGIEAGDVLVQVDGVEVGGLPLNEVVSMVLGPAGTTVSLTLRDPDTNTIREVTITRARIDLDNVTWEMLPGTKVAHLRLSAFSEGVGEDLQRALQEIQSQDGSGVIFDLRNNGGGLLGEAVTVASQFLTQGNVLLQKNAQGEVREITVESGGIAPEMPVVVLINRGSASAAEIVAGALQDAGRAQLVGETTFGTGTVLLPFDLSDGSSILLAIEQWLTPKGRVIWRQGIPPDVDVPLPEEAAPLIPEQEQNLTPEALESSGDTQLLKALEIIQGLIAK